MARCVGRVEVAQRAALTKVKQTAFARGALALQAGVGRTDDAGTAADAGAFTQAGSRGRMVRMRQVTALGHCYAAWMAVAAEEGSRST